MEAELSPAVLDVLGQAHVGLTSIVATTSEDGSSHTAPFGSMRALDPRRLRFGCDRTHDTYANLVRDPRVTVCVLAPPDIAVSISGRARVSKAEMDTVSSDAVVEIGIEEVKNDMLPGAAIETGISYSVPDEMRDFIRDYVDEVESA